MNVLSLISVLQSVEREFQSLAQTKDSELAEAQQQLRQKVSVKSFLVISEMILQYSKYFSNICLHDCRRNSYYPVRRRKRQLDND